jgi:DNA-binding transcriptional LysR family regulator
MLLSSFMAYRSFAFDQSARNPKMELKQIRYFVAIVDYGSLTKAANQLRLAQPALSLQVSNLEAECGAQLLIRTAKGVIPTEIGKILYRHGRIMLRQLEQAREEMKSGVKTISGLVALGLPTTVTVPLAMPLVRAVREESTKNRGRLGSLDRCGSGLLAKSPVNLGARERAGGPAAGASPTVLGALTAR